MNDYSEQLAATILQQCTVGALMTVGACDFRVIEQGVAFTVHLHDFDHRGHRFPQSKPMTMRITLNSSDYYDVRVTHQASTGDHLATLTHWEGEDLDFTQLSSLLLALDYDGDDSVLNPRYF